VNGGWPIPSAEAGPDTSSPAPTKGKTMKETRKSPVLAGIFSLLPGLGQVYVGYYVTGFVYIMVVAGVMAIIADPRGHETGPLLPMFLSFFWLFNIIDAVRRANAYNLHYTGEEEKPAPTDSPLVGGLVLLVAGILFTLKYTFGLEMEWLRRYWPLGLVLGGAYLVWKYLRTRRRLRSE